MQKGKKKKKKRELIIIEIPLLVILEKNKGGKNEWGCIEGARWLALYCFIRGRIQWRFTGEFYWELSQLEYSS